MRPPFIIAFAIAASAYITACSNTRSNPVKIPEWIEADSAQAINRRIAIDFPMTYDDLVQTLQDKYPEMSPDSVRYYVDKHYIETTIIDGVERVHRKALKNLTLLNPEMNGGWQLRGGNASPARISYVDSVISWTEGRNRLGGAHRVKMQFNITVPYVPALADDTLRVWMPYPEETARQTDIKLTYTSQPDYIISTPQQSAHRTIYFSAPVLNGKPTEFTYEVEFTTAGVYNSPDSIMAHLKPYDTASAEYKKFTAFDSPHIVPLDSLARHIVGSETNPFKCSELVYDYIIHKYPWAGAREYSTIPCIPEYVVGRSYGDCGQVTLLYISLMRTLGIPARWESGWMLHPGEVNLHDWAEVYFEGTGWVPVDVSFGRYTPSPDPRVVNFYSTSIDAHRFAANSGIGDRFYPPKRFIRSETVDAQVGEVECSKGNIFYPGWDQQLRLLSVTPVKK